MAGVNAAVKRNSIVSNMSRQQASHAVPQTTQGYSATYVKVTEMSSLLPEPHFMLCLEPVYKLLAAAIPTSAQTPVLMFMP